MNDVAAIEVRGLVKSYGEHTVLRTVDLHVARGEVLGLVGPNGSGKSTLLRTLVGLVARTSGDVRVLGLDPAHDSLGIRRRACYLPGETGAYLQMTGEQFLAFAFGFHARVDGAVQRELLASFALPLSDKIRNYSAGMKQKLALIATLAPDVDLYLLDEPDRALDPSVRLFLRDVLLSLRDAGKTIVLSSHHLGEVESLTNRLEFLDDGAFVSAERLAAARERLQRWPRVRLHTGATLPASTRVVHRERDGTLVVETDGDAVAWLRSLPDGVVEKAEAGVARLDDLYELLLRERAAADRNP